MRITVVLMVLLSAVMIADTDAQYGIEGDAYVFGSHYWDGYFTILFRDAETLEDLYLGTYNNIDPILVDYFYKTTNTVNMLCTLYSSAGNVRAVVVYLGITGDCPITQRDIYFEPACIAIGIDTWTNATVLLPEPLSLGGATWAEIKALDF